MIEFGKLTGEVSGTYVQVMMRTGECLYAPMIVIGTGVSLPSADWIKVNKDHFLALVTYEGTEFHDPMLLGFYPVKGASSASFNTTDRLVVAVSKLIEQLLKAKVNTQIGPQPFMQDTIKILNELKDELTDISKLIANVNM